MNMSEWRKSSCSLANDCVEAAWRTSGRSQNNGGCVEAAACADGAFVHVRDSKDPDGRISPTVNTVPGSVDYSVREWDGGNAVQFTAVDAGSVPAELRAIRAERIRERGLGELEAGSLLAAGWFAVFHDQGTLYFDANEVLAWREGVRAGEFASA